MKNLKPVTLLAGLFMLGTFSACDMNCEKGSGNATTEKRKVADFTNIEISGDYKITLKQDSSLSLNITADDNLIKLIKTDVSGGVLNIKSKNFCASKQMEIVIGVRNLERLRSSGAVNILSDGNIKVKDLELHTTGASKVTLDLNADHLTAEGSGATELYLKGQAASSAITLTGGGKIDALDFVVTKYDLQTTGAAECKINVLTELNVQATGAADVQYKGSPTVNANKTGAATIKKIE